LSAIYGETLNYEPDTPLNNAYHVGSLIYKIHKLKGQMNYGKH
jgi:hypothetical protein